MHCIYQLIHKRLFAQVWYNYNFDLQFSALCFRYHNDRMINFDKGISVKEVSQKNKEIFIFIFCSETHQLLHLHLLHLNQSPDVLWFQYFYQIGFCEI